MEIVWKYFINHLENDYTSREQIIAYWALQTEQKETEMRGDDQEYRKSKTIL